MAAHQDAITDIRAQLQTDWLLPDGPVQDTAGQQATASVYRSATLINRHGEKAYVIMGVLNIPASRSYVTHDDTERVQDAAEALMDWAAAKPSKDWQIYWPNPPQMTFDYSDGATATVMLTVCDVYPRGL